MQDHEMVREGNGFVVREGEEVIAEVTFRPSGDATLVLDHTFVDPRLRGQGIAEKLVKRVVELAREEGKKIIPACSYADAQFRRHSEYHDVWER
ncbi:GNAT family N-acetyltransferase [Gorillibacterium sp. sgz500922]|uniref:GNAT family N-acetyltransferase n=1 Tax=Gorillibacterium sp. sgz500922 TaxID=3446694 RepID=UPI003F66A259